MWTINKHPEPDAQLTELEADLRQTRADLAQAYRRFDQALDPELVESCIYQIEALKARYNYLLRTVKARRAPVAAAAAALGGKKKWI